MLVPARCRRDRSVRLALGDDGAPAAEESNVAETTAPTAGGRRRPRRPRRPSRRRRARPARVVRLRRAADRHRGVRPLPHRRRPGTQHVRFDTAGRPRRDIRLHLPRRRDRLHAAVAGRRRECAVRPRLESDRRGDRGDRPLGRRRRPLDVPEDEPMVPTFGVLGLEDPDQIDRRERQLRRRARPARRVPLLRLRPDGRRAVVRRVDGVHPPADPGRAPRGRLPRRRRRPRADRPARRRRRPGRLDLLRVQPRTVRRDRVHVGAGPGADHLPRGERAGGRAGRLLRHADALPLRRRGARRPLDRGDRLGRRRRRPTPSTSSRTSRRRRSRVAPTRPDRSATATRHEPSSSRRTGPRVCSPTSSSAAAGTSWTTSRR